MKTKLLLLSAAGLLVALTRTPAATHYVDAASTNAVAPFTNWANAATNIQDAVDVAVDGDLILVTNGVYQTGARNLYGMSNRVAVTKAVTVRSVNGPGVTQIVGYQVPNTIFGEEAVRCVYMTNGAVLAGFTLTNGTTHRTDDPEVDPVSTAGGGVWCESQSAVVTNCVLAGNFAFEGGGAYYGTLNNCTLTDNSAIPTFFDSSGGGAYGSALNNCTLTGNWADLGGGAYSSTLNNCTLTGNSSPQAGGGGAAGSTLNNCTLTDNTGNEGGGASYSTLNNCTLTGNAAGDGGGAASSTLNNCTLTGNLGDGGGGAIYSTLNNCTLTGNWGNLGGGAFESMLNNCTVTGNSAGGGSFRFGGGTFGGTMKNCIVYNNTARALGDNYYGGVFNYCSTTPDPGSGVGNITNEPAFVDSAGGNLRLQSNSPCINAGNNAYATNTTDLDGRPRIVGGVVDMGAYEYQGPGMGEFIGWLQQCSLPTGGSADYVDTDHDGHNNRQEWMAGTDPTNALSVLRLASPVITPTNVTFTWTSVTNRTYTLEQATNLGGAQAFSVLRGNLAGLPGTTSWTDTNAPVSSPRFYRLRVLP